MDENLALRNLPPMWGSFRPGQPVIVFAFIGVFLLAFVIGYIGGLKDGRYIERHESGCTRYCLSSDCKKHNSGKASCPMESGR